MPEKTYTQEEVEQLQKEWESNLFEEKTKEFMVEVRTRLDQSNGYKETFGKDLIEIKLVQKEIQLRLLTLENAKLREEAAAKEAASQRHMFWQDKHVRIIGYGGLVLWFLTWLQNSGGLKVAGKLLGLS